MAPIVQAAAHKAYSLPFQALTKTRLRPLNDPMTACDTIVLEQLLFALGHCAVFVNATGQPVRIFSLDAFPVLMMVSLEKPLPEAS